MSLTLSQLLALWRETFAPEVAKAIELLEPVAPALTKPIGKRTAAARTRMLDLANHPDDPRLDAFLYDLLVTPALTSRGSQPYWLALFDLVETRRDPAFVTRLEALPAHWDAHFEAEGMRAWLKQQLAKRLPGIRRRASKPRGLTEAGRKAVQATLEALAPVVRERARDAAAARDAESFLASIYENPRDDSERLVFADWLTERGDPRGELIALQIAGRDPERVRKLLRQHEKEWLPPIFRRVAMKKVGWERGFPARIDLKQSGLEATDPALRTVEDLGWDWAADPSFLRLPALRALRAMDGPAVITLLTMKQPPALERLELQGYLALYGEIDTVAEVAARLAKRIPGLRELAGVHAGYGFEYISPYLEHPNLETLSADSGHLLEGQRIDGSWRFRASSTRPDEELIDFLERALVPDAIAALEVTLSAPPPACWKKLEAAARRCRLELTSTPT